MAGSRKPLLKIEPSNELDFFGPFTTVQPSIINLTNPTDNRITFKVKTTVPKRYCVRPSCGIVEPSETVSVAVMLQPFDCDGAEKNKHKFMIQSMVLEDENAENLEHIWKEANPSQISDTRLKCTLRLPDDLLKYEPEELVFEGPVSESSTCILSVRNTAPKDVVFKVKTNAPKRYIVTPNEGIIKARETQIIKVATVAGVDSAGESRDRIALLSVVAPDELPASVGEIWHTVDKAKISEKFLACSFPNQEQGIAPNQSNKLAQLTQEIEKLRKENEELKHHQAVLNRLGRETSAPALAPAASGPIDAFRMNIPPILYLLITFLFALAVGKFIL